MMASTSRMLCLGVISGLFSDSLLKSRRIWGPLLWTLNLGSSTSWVLSAVCSGSLSWAPSFYFQGSKFNRPSVGTDHLIWICPGVGQNSLLFTGRFPLQNDLIVKFQTVFSSTLDFLQTNPFYVECRSAEFQCYGLNFLFPDFIFLYHCVVNII